MWLMGDVQCSKARCCCRGLLPGGCACSGCTGEVCVGQNVCTACTVHVLDGIEQLVAKEGGTGRGLGEGKREGAGSCGVQCGGHCAPLRVRWAFRGMRLLC